MGWASGSMLAQEIWEAVAPYIPKEQRHDVATKVCNAFEEMDCDTLYEVEDLYNAAYPWAIVTGEAEEQQIEDQFASQADAEARLATYRVPARIIDMAK